ncbi:MAG: helix-turn-helix domain-containing protein, partial [Streptosporangiaceae bacterium]
MSDHSPEAGQGREPDPERIVTPQEFGHELTLLRHRADLTVRQVAKAAGLPASTTGDYFSGRHLPAPGQGRGSESLHKILAACGETDPARLGLWTAALGRARRPPGKRASGKNVASGDAPYRGLASFGPQDAPWFFGREDVTQRLVELATGWGIGAGVGLPLIVTGPSGSGKSSLLQAGLMPRLTGPVTLFVPTATPAADLGAQLTAETRYVIVDQFETVFTRCQD